MSMESPAEQLRELAVELNGIADDLDAVNDLIASGHLDDSPEGRLIASVRAALAAWEAGK